MFFYVDSASELPEKSGTVPECWRRSPITAIFPRTGLKLSTKISMSVSDRFWMVKMVHLEAE